MQDTWSVMTAELPLVSLALGETLRDLTFIVNTGYSFKGEQWTKLQAACDLQGCNFAANTTSRLGPLPIAPGPDNTHSLFSGVWIKKWSNCAYEIAGWCLYLMRGELASAAFAPEPVWA